MNFLVGMETSGAVRGRLRALGVDAWSVDLLPSEDASPFHVVGNVFDYIDHAWDGALFHPTCTYLTNSAEWAYKEPPYHQKLKPTTLYGAMRRMARENALADVRRLMAVRYPYIIENPRGVIGSRIRRATQIVHPYMFGDDASKATCLWIERLPPLDVWPWLRFPGRIVNGVERWSNQTDAGQNRLSPSDDRWAERSRTYPGIADALAQHIARHLTPQPTQR